MAADATSWWTTAADTLGIVIRPPETEKELNAIRDSWTRNYSDQRPARVTYNEQGRAIRVERMPTGEYYVAHRAYVDSTLGRPGVIVRVAGIRAARQTIAGWLVYERRPFGPTVIHYCYVFRDFRRQGVAKILCGDMLAAEVRYANWTPRVGDLEAAGKLPKMWKWDEIAKWR